MPFEPTKKDLQVNYSVDLREETTPVVVNLSAVNGTISRVIFISNKAHIDSVITNTGSAQIEGKIRSNVLVQNTDGSFVNLSATTPFSVPIINPDLNTDSQLLATAKILNINSVQASENMVSFTANVCVKPILIVAKCTQILENVDSIAEQKRDTINYVDIISATAQEFDLSVELDLPQSISSILNIDTTTVLNEVEAGNDLVALHGEIYCNMIYLTNDDEPKLKNHHYIQEFTHEILATGVLISDFANANLENIDSHYELTGEINSAKGTIVLDNRIKANLIIGQAKSSEAVVDAFCPNYKLETDFTEFSQQSALNVCNSEKIDGSINLGEDSTRIDKVLCVSEGNIVVKSVAQNEGNFTVSGTLMCDVVYKLDNDEGSIESVLAEIPFELNIKNENVHENSVLRVDINPREIDARNKRAKEIELLAEVNVFTTIINTQSEQVLSDISLGEKRTQNTSALGYYVIPQANSLWDVSKMLLVSGDVIMQQNPDLQFPFSTPQKVIVYRQKIVN